jgi:CRISPR/Cas system CSM-associated protein Csm2 small subunit
LAISKYKIENLAKEIVANFDLIPSERIIILQNESNEYIVREGNRRVCAYKLLSDPNKSPEGKRKLFRKLSNEIELSEDYEIECILTNTKEEANRYLTIKHEKSNNEISWGSTEVANFKKRIGSAKQLDYLYSEISRNIRELKNFPEEIIEKVLGVGYITTLYRILEGKAATEKFDFKIDKDGKLSIGDSKFMNKLKVIIIDIYQNGKYKDKIFSRLNQQEIKEYLDGIDQNKINKVEQEIKKLPIQQTLAGERKLVLPSPNSQFSKNEGNGTSRKPSILKSDDRLFGKVLNLKKCKVTNLYLAINKIYEQNKGNAPNLEIVLPIIGMSMRLILDTAAREYYKENNNPSKDDAVYKKFIDEIKKEYKSQGKTEESNLVALNDLFNDTNFEAYLAKYAHGNIIYTKSDILKISKIVGEILEKFFGRTK